MVSRAAQKQLLVHNVEHFEKRGVRGNVARFVFDELALRLRILLPPDSKLEVHWKEG